jgi:tRNA 2-selenouridine synthase
LGQLKQPSQEMFENKLGWAISKIENPSKPVWIEDESQRIGTVMVPIIFFKLMRSSPCYFLNIPFESRLAFIATQYGSFSKEDLIAATLRIQKRLGGLETKNSVQHLENGDTLAAFEILLKYYDKWYTKFSKPTTEPNLYIINLDAEAVNEEANAKLLLALNK